MPHPPGFPKGCIYPQSHATAHPILRTLEEVVANADESGSFYLDTTEVMSKGGEDHAQGLARTHVLSTGDIYWFQSNSYVEDGSVGTITVYHYGNGAPLDGEHVVTTAPEVIANMTESMWTPKEQHPSDIVFLPEVDNRDAGYLFVTMEYDLRCISVYFWQPGHKLVPIGQLTSRLDLNGANGPNFLFVDRQDDYYYLGGASSHWGRGTLYKAKASDLFPNCQLGGMNVDAFQLALPSDLVNEPDDSHFPFPITAAEGPCQVKLVRDSYGLWFLLSFRAVPPTKEPGDDYIDVYTVTMMPFSIGCKPLATFHIDFPPTGTGFASTGTHYVDKKGRFMVSSSFRWSQNLFPGGVGYVSRVDELPSDY
jgi:hypothetical protein